MLRFPGNPNVAATDSPVTMSDLSVISQPVIQWNEAGEEKSARWRSESGTPPPKRVVIADDRTTADSAYRLACEGTALLWRGDFQNARQLLQAMTRRANEKPGARKNKEDSRHTCGSLSPASPSSIAARPYPGHVADTVQCRPQYSTAPRA